MKIQIHTLQKAIKVLIVAAYAFGNQYSPQKTRAKAIPPEPHIGSTLLTTTHPLVSCILYRSDTHCWGFRQRCLAKANDWDRAPFSERPQRDTSVDVDLS